MCVSVYVQRAACVCIYKEANVRFPDRSSTVSLSNTHYAADTMTSAVFRGRFATHDISARVSNITVHQIMKLHAAAKDERRCETGRFGPNFRRRTETSKT